MPEPDLLKIAGLQDEVKEQKMTNEEAKAKLDLFEKMFAEGYYIQARKIADELYFEEINSARGYAMVCSRAYPYYERLFVDKGEASVIRINNIFRKYHFGEWTSFFKHGKGVTNKFKNEKEQV